MAAEVDAKALRKAIKRRVPYLDQHREEITLKAVRRLLEGDMSLPSKTLDEPALKASISSQVDEIMALLLQKHADEKARAAAPAAKASEAAAKDDACDSGFADENARLKTKLKAEGKVKRHSTPTEAAPVPPKLGSSERAMALKAILKQCTINVSPSLYRQAAGDEVSFVTLLEGLLAAEGLAGAHPSRDAIEVVRRRKELARDLDGIDATNILQTVGRPRRAATVAAVHQAHAAATAEAAAGSGEDARSDDRDGSAKDEAVETAGAVAPQAAAATEQPALVAPWVHPASATAAAEDAQPKRRRVVVRIDEWDDDDA